MSVLPGEYLCSYGGKPSMKMFRKNPWGPAWCKHCLGTTEVQKRRCQYCPGNAYVRMGGNLTWSLGKSWGSRIDASLAWMILKFTSVDVSGEREMQKKKMLVWLLSSYAKLKYLYDATRRCHSKHQHVAILSMPKSSNSHTVVFKISNFQMFIAKSVVIILKFQTFEYADAPKEQNA